VVALGTEVVAAGVDAVAPGTDDAVAGGAATFGLTPAGSLLGERTPWPCVCAPMACNGRGSAVTARVASVEAEGRWESI
jgi:hypothetical protein